MVIERAEVQWSEPVVFRNVDVLREFVTELFHSPVSIRLVIIYER